MEHLARGPATVICTHAALVRQFVGVLLSHTRAYVTFCLYMQTSECRICREDPAYYAAIDMWMRWLRAGCPAELAVVDADEVRYATAVFGGRGGDDESLFTPPCKIRVPSVVARVFGNDDAGAYVVARSVCCLPAAGPLLDAYLFHAHSLRSPGLPSTADTVALVLTAALTDDAQVVRVAVRRAALLFSPHNELLPIARAAARADAVNAVAVFRGAGYTYDSALLRAAADAGGVAVALDMHERIALMGDVWITVISRAVKNGDAHGTRMLLDACGKAHNQLAALLSPWIIDDAVRHRHGTVDVLQALHDAGVRVATVDMLPRFAMLRRADAVRWVAEHLPAGAAQALLIGGAMVAKMDIASVRALAAAGVRFRATVPYVQMYTRLREAVTAADTAAATEASRHLPPSVMQQRMAAVFNGIPRLARVRLGAAVDERTDTPFAARFPDMALTVAALADDVDAVTEILSAPRDAELVVTEEHFNAAISARSVAVVRILLAHCDSMPPKLVRTAVTSGDDAIVHMLAAAAADRLPLATETYAWLEQNVAAYTTAAIFAYPHYVRGPRAAARDGGDTELAYAIAKFVDALGERYVRLARGTDRRY